MANPDISLYGTVYSGVSGVTLPKNGGGTATFPFVEGSQTVNANGTYDVSSLAQMIVNVSGGGSYPWFGQNTTFVERKLNKTINLNDDTSFDSWTASTTAGAIKAASSSDDFSVTADYTNAYWVFLRSIVDVAYLSSATKKNISRRIAQYYTYLIFPYYSTYAALGSGNANSVTYGSLTTRSGQVYYGSTTNSLTYGTSGTYGPMYMSAGPTITASGTTYGFKLAAINARCSSTYFATSRKAGVDSANTNMVITADVYKTPVPNSWISWEVEQMRTELLSGL